MGGISQQSGFYLCRVEHKPPNFKFFKIGFIANWDTLFKLTFSLNFCEIPICQSCSVAFYDHFNFHINTH